MKKTDAFDFLESLKLTLSLLSNGSVDTRVIMIGKLGDKFIKMSFQQCTEQEADDHPSGITVTNPKEF